MTASAIPGSLPSADAPLGTDSLSVISLHFTKKNHQDHAAILA
jgi:hypothetical protein